VAAPAIRTVLRRIADAVLRRVQNDFVAFGMFLISPTRKVTTAPGRAKVPRQLGIDDAG
jgi:hypothetical protein